MVGASVCRIHYLPALRRLTERVAAMRRDKRKACTFARIVCHGAYVGLNADETAYTCHGNSFSLDEHVHLAVPFVRQFLRYLKETN